MTAIDRPIVVDPSQGDIMYASSWSVFSRLGYTSANQPLEVIANFYEMEGEGDYRAVPGNAAQRITATSATGDQRTT